MICWSKIVIRPSICVGICVSAVVLPIYWTIAWVIAGLIHELGHIITLKLFMIPIHKISFAIGGAYIETGYMRNIDEIIVSAAGPVAGLLGMLIFFRYPYIALCAFIQSIYNLLPFPCYDGGRIISAFADIILSTLVAQKVYSAIMILTAALLVAVGLYMWIMLGLGVISFLLFVIPVLKSGIIKIPCKR